MKLLTAAEKAELYNKLQSMTFYKDDCWLYQGFKHGVHYVGLRVNGKRVLAHRVSAAIFLGLDLDRTDLQVNHRNECKHKSCWKPDHLYMGTQADNMKDLSAKMREDKTCKVCGHLRVEVRTTSRGKKTKRLECNNCRRNRRIKNASH